MFCEDETGCGECYDGYYRWMDDVCGVYYCQDIDTVDVEGNFAELNDIWDLLVLNESIPLNKKREKFVKIVCEASWDYAIVNGFIDEKCEIPDNFEDCSNEEINPETGDIDLTLEELLLKPGVAESPCLQEIRIALFEWHSQTNQLLDLCNGAFDPEC